MNCKICNTHFSTKQSYKLHEESIHSNIRYDCQECGKQFTQKSSLTTHINGVHKGIKYKCKKCDNEYASASGRYNHNKLTHERITYKHEQCDKELSTKLSNKSLHKKFDNFNSVNKIIKYNCEQCNAEFAYASVKLKHVKEVHGPKKYLCTLCDYRGHIIRHRLILLMPTSVIITSNTD